MQEPQAGRQEGDDRRRLMLKETAAFRKGAWSQLQPQPGGWGIETSDGFVGCAWVGEAGRHVVVVNYAGNQGQCRLFLPFPELRARQVRLTDVMGTEVHHRDGSDLADNGLFIDHAPWHFNVFELHVATG
jgi:hypothetical protein